MEGDVLMSPVTVVFLDKNRIQFYESRDGTLVSLEVPETIMRDLEIANPTALGESVKTFLNQNHISASVSILVFSDTVVLTRELTGTREEKELEFQKFLDAVPFENILSRRYVFGEHDIAIAMPRAGFEPLIAILQEARFPVMAVVPTFTLGPMKNKRWLDAEMGKFVAGKAETIAAESITPMVNVPVSTGARSPMIVRGISRAAIGIAVFILLIIVLFFLVIGRI